MVVNKLPPLRPVLTALCVLAFLVLAAGVDYWLSLVVLLSFLAGLFWRWLRPSARLAWALAGLSLLAVACLFFLSEYWRRAPLVQADTLPVARVTRYEAVVSPPLFGLPSFPRRRDCGRD
jgi:hypothetical protein